MHSFFYLTPSSQINFQKNATRVVVRNFSLPWGWWWEPEGVFWLGSWVKISIFNFYDSYLRFLVIWIPYFWKFSPIFWMYIQLWQKNSAEFLERDKALEIWKDISLVVLVAIYLMLTWGLIYSLKKGKKE